MTVAYLGSSPIGQAQQPGEQEYQTLCAPCHTIGANRLIGPDLIGVHDRRSEAWLVEFVQSSQSMIERGDPDAVAVFQEYSGLPMPDAPLSETQIRDVLSYIRTASEAVAAGAAPVVLALPGSNAETASPSPAPTATPAEPPADAGEAASAASEQPSAPEAEISLGQDLFQGRVRFENGGPTCNSCHEVVNDAVVGGGSLSVELTTAFSRLGGAGVQAIVRTAPFPVMQAAYDEKALTANEITALASFLQFADQQAASQSPRDYGLDLLVRGLIGTVLFFALCAFVWRGRKRESVNQTIFDRQAEASWED